MSRRELAALVNQYIWDNYGQRSGLDENYIGKLERGLVRWPSEVYREALCAVLGVVSEAELGFWPPTGQRRVHPQRQQAVAPPQTEAVAAASLLEGMTPTPTPRRLGRSEIDQIWGVAEAFSRWDNLYGGLAREAPLAQLRWSTGLLRGHACPLELRPALLSAVGYLAHTCGFMAFDAYAFEDARRLLAFGVACAEEAGDWHLRARLLATRARLDTWVGDPDEGLTHTQLALVRSDRLTATERAMLYSLEARALARMGRVQHTQRAIGRADDAFADQSVADDPGWMGYYDAAQHAGDVGTALLDLALAGSTGPQEARLRHLTAIETRRPDLARSRALSQVGLAKLIIVTGDPAEAVPIGHAALDTAGPIRSRRVADELSDLGRRAEPHGARSDVQELRQRLATVTVS